MASEEVASGSGGSQYKPITDEDTLARLRTQGLTEKGLLKVSKGDLRCRPPRQITDTYFDKKLPQFRLKTVVETARAEDIVMIWAFITQRDQKLRTLEFRFDPNVYLTDTELMAKLQSLSNSSGEMMRYLKDRLGTVRRPEVTLPSQEPTAAVTELPPDIHRLIYKAPVQPTRIEVTATKYKHMFSQDLVRAVHRAAWDGQAKATFDLATIIGDFNVPFSKYQYTPLHQVVLGNTRGDQYNVLTAERLLIHGSLVDAVDVYGKTPLHHASRRNDVEMMEMLLSHGAHVDVVACDGSTPLHAAAESGAVDAVQKLLERGAGEFGAGSFGTPLHWAARTGRHSVVRLLVEKQFDINAVDWYLSTPLHVAARSEHANCLRLLLAYRADKEAKDADGRTALHVALTWGVSQCVQLLSAGFKPHDMPVIQRVVDPDLELQKQRVFWDEMNEEELAAFKDTFLSQREMSSWMDWFVRVKTHVKKYGMLPGTPELGWWYRYQSHHKLSLGAWQIQELESLPGFTWWEPLHKKLRCLSRYMRLKLYVSSTIRRGMQSFNSWRDMILTLKSKNALSRNQQNLLELYSQGPYHDDFWDIQPQPQPEAEAEPPQPQQSQARQLHATFPSDIVPGQLAINVIESLRESHYPQYNRLRSHLSLNSTEDVRQCLDMWRELNLFGGNEMPWRPEGGVYIVNRSAKGVKDGYEYGKESRSIIAVGKVGMFTRRYANTRDGTLQRRIHQETAPQPQQTPLIIVQYIPKNPSPMDLLARAASEPASVQMEEDVFDFLNGVPKRQRTSYEVPENMRKAEAALAVLSKEIVEVTQQRQQQPVVAPTELPATAVEGEGAGGETITSYTEVSASIREMLASTSLDSSMAMGMALKALYDHGVGGSDMRWAASHIVGKKLGAEEKKYLFESVREYVLQGKVEEAVEWVKEIKGAMDF